MTPSQSLIELAERCERATGPDKRLGAEVVIAMRGFPERAYRQKNAMRPRGSSPLDRLEWAADWFGSGPTGSLDVAMTLVPDRAQFTLTTDGPHYLTHVNGFTARAPTLALALTAACLRALSNSPEEKEG